ncbi:tripartite tricarboxylate transporter TctB family protein [Rubrobacter taiwanensis]|jgi:hypothetical protein|nr:tripartite tricarboxylate transporter TctB family protein [Rubrobacter taiwanensis]
MTLRKYQDAIIAVLLLGFAGLFAYQAGQLPQEHVQRAPGMAIYPLLVAVAIGIASFVLLVRSLIKAEDAGSEEKQEPEVDLEEGVTSRNESEEDRSAEAGKQRLAPHILFPIVGIAILVSYGWALEAVGYLVATPALLALLLLAYGVRSWKVIVGLSAGATAVIYLVFYYLLLIRLP